MYYNNDPFSGNPWLAHKEQSKRLDEIFNSWMSKEDITKKNIIVWDSVPDFLKSIKDRLHDKLN